MPVVSCRLPVVGCRLPLTVAVKKPLTAKGAKKIGELECGSWILCSCRNRGLKPFFVFISNAALKGRSSTVVHISASVQPTRKKLAEWVGREAVGAA